MTLAISDVPHDDPSAIASGPTVPDPTTLADARAIVERYKLQVDDAVRRARLTTRNESCKPGDAGSNARFGLIARPKDSLDAAIAVAKKAGYDVLDLGADLEGEARDVAGGSRKACLKARTKDGGSGKFLRAGVDRHRARQRTRRPQPGIRAGAGQNLLADTTDISILAGDTDGADGGVGIRLPPILQARSPISAHFRVIRELNLDKPRSTTTTPRPSCGHRRPSQHWPGHLTNVNDIRVILIDP